DAVARTDTESQIFLPTGNWYYQLLVKTGDLTLEAPCEWETITHCAVRGLG
ncbi:hypothetical protein SAMN03080598_04316, partial [Algoriphagus boritolerans DSM 17298 = JCM 18970]